MNRDILALMAQEKLKDKAERVKREAITLYFALSDPRTPWYAKVIVALTVGYALSPIDIIPD
ncbi:MAG: DUF1232 domain-containing protein, partial [Spirochaetales bacterium]